MNSNCCTLLSWLDLRGCMLMTSQCYQQTLCGISWWICLLVSLLLLIWEWFLRSREGSPYHFPKQQEGLLACGCRALAPNTPAHLEMILVERIYWWCLDVPRPPAPCSRNLQWFAWAVKEELAPRWSWAGCLAPSTALGKGTGKGLCAEWEHRELASTKQFNQASVWTLGPPGMDICLFQWWSGLKSMSTFISEMCDSVRSGVHHRTRFHHNICSGGNCTWFLSAGCCASTSVIFMSHLLGKFS